MKINHSFKDYEARINLLRKRTTQTPATETSETSTKDEAKIVSSTGHVDLFADHEDKQKKVKPMDEEKRLEQEKYEKQIGYLTYLGQDTHEALGTQSWYNAPRERHKPDECTESGEKVEIGLKTKHLNDPMFQFLKKSFTTETKKSSEKKDLPNVSTKSAASELHGISIGIDRSRKRKRSISQERKHKKSKSSKKSKEKKEKKKKHKKEKRKRKHSSSGESHSDSESEQLRQHKLQNLQKLREERLQRERQEQNRTKDFLRNKFPALLPPEEVKKPDESSTEQPRLPLMKQKYNSQFNPYLAKQNYSN